MTLSPIGLAVAAYLVGLIVVALVARGRIADVEDFVVAGRQLGFGLTTTGLLATWIGAGSLLVAADEIRAVGLTAVVGEPVGGGLALIIAALVAGRIRRYRVLTVPDLFRRMYGARAEGLLTAITLAIDMSWTAVQYLALGSIVELYLGVPRELAVPIIAVLGLAKTLLGGMHALAMSDALHLGFVAGGMLLIGAGCLFELGHGEPLRGLEQLGALPPSFLDPLPPASEALPWLALLLSASVGNATDPAILLRVSSARTPRIATAACLTAGVVYLLLGSGPIVAGLTAALRLPVASREAVMPKLAGLLLDPWWAAAVIVAMVATLLATLDSALLTQSAIVARNIGNRILGLEETVLLHRVSLVLVAAVTVGFTKIDVRPFRLLTMSYEAGLVATVLPILLGTWWPADEDTALASIGLGGVTWLYASISGRALLGVPIPPALVSMAVAVVTYVVLAGVRSLMRRRED